MAQNTEIEVAQVIGHMKKKGSFKIVIIGFALGLALLLIGSFALKDKENEGGENIDGGKIAVSFEKYKTDILGEIEEICLSVDGVKSAKAAVYFEGVGGSIYAQNTQIGNTNKSEYVIIGSGSNSHALYLGEALPKISGVGVVCDTGGDQNKRNELALLLSSVYGLPMNRVYVSEG